MKLQANSCPMMFSVPQFIDVEDKIAGPLTWKQLGWMIGMGAAGLVEFAIFDTALAIIIAIPTVLLFCALAFYKPNGFPMTLFLANAVMFLFRPKISVWERPTAVVPRPVTPEKKEITPPVVVKQVTREKIAELARLIDRR